MAVGEQSEEHKMMVDTDWLIRKSNGLYVRQLDIELSIGRCFELATDATPLGSRDYNISSLYCADLGLAGFCAPTKNRGLLHLGCHN